jgi:cytochrome d ubiquinol oxidase subunit II
VSKPEAVAAILVIGATLYAVFGGADFGAGVWELLAGRAKDPDAVRARIWRSLTPVWEANHVWLIFLLVTLWTGFPEAFATIMSTLYVPLALAALGIVLRGSGFALGKEIEGRARSQASAVFAVSSVLTPFFMGTVVGSIASGDVVAHEGEALDSWIGLLPLVTGALFVASGAYISAVFFVSDSRAAGEEGNAEHFARCALGAALLAGGVAAAGVLALHRDAPFVYDGLTGPGLPLLILSVLCGAAALALLVRVVRRGFDQPGLALLRPAAVGAVVTVIWGWAVAQHPYLFPETLTIDEAAAPDGTLSALLVLFGAALVIVVPALLLLYSLQQRRVLDE